jgi:hypothetical protein
MTATPCPACGEPLTAGACPRCEARAARPLPTLDPNAVRLALHKTGGRFRRPPSLRRRDPETDTRPPAAA